MADATQPEGTPKPAEQAGEATPKVWNDTEVRTIIEERDKAKAKLRKITEDEQKAAEAKAVEEGKLKELLAQKSTELEQLRKFKEAKDAEDAAVRASALAKLSDEDKDIAAELSTPKLLAYVERQNKSVKAPPSTSKGGAADGPEGSVHPLPDETAEAYAARMKKIGKVR